MTTNHPNAGNPPPEDTSDMPMMHGASGPMSLAGLLLGAAAVILFFYPAAPADTGFGVVKPPALLALNLSFCAMFLGIASVYRVRGMAGQKHTRIMAALGLLLGLMGPAIYARQTLLWRQAMEAREEANVQALVTACRAYATENAGVFPPDFAALVKRGTIKPTQLQSPYEIKPDYVYEGQDLRQEFAAKDPNFAHDVILVHSEHARMGTWVIAGFVDGRVDFVKEQDVAEMVKKSDAARAALGLPPLKIAPAENNTQPAPRSPSPSR